MVASPSSTPRNSSALEGCKVLEIGRFVTGPFAAQLLADLGAEVIKIEDPKGGDPFRGWGRAGWDGYGAPFLGFNRNKKSLTLDLKDPRALFGVDPNRCLWDGKGWTERQPAPVVVPAPVTVPAAKPRG